MVALLRYMYDLPFHTNGSEKWPTKMSSCTELYVTAGKYLIKELQHDVCRHMKNSSCFRPGRKVILDVADFVQALRQIMTCTVGDNCARRSMVSSCTTNLKLLRKEKEFVSLLRDFGDLGADIIEHEELECAILGSWTCSNSCTDEVEPVCPQCSEPFMTDDAWCRRDDESWWCYMCRKSTHPVCANCDRDVSWMQRDVI